MTTDAPQPATENATEAERAASSGLAFGGVRPINPWPAGGIGALVAGGCAVGDLFWPARAVLVGALLTMGVFLVRPGGHKRYLLAGAVYLLGLALLVEVAGPGAVGQEYHTAVQPAAAVLGAIAGAFVLVKVVGGRIVRRLAAWATADEDFAAQVWEFLSSIASLLVMAWIVLTFWEKATRYVGVSIGTLILFVANAAGYQWFLSPFGFEFELLMFLFVCCVLLAFNLADTVHNSVRTVALGGLKGLGLVGWARDRFDEDRAE